MKLIIGQYYIASDKFFFDRPNRPRNRPLLGEKVQFVRWTGGWNPMPEFVRENGQLYSGAFAYRYTEYKPTWTVKQKVNK